MNSSAKHDETPAPARGLTLRAVVLALILAVINDYWLGQLEVVRISYPTYGSPFYNCIFTLLLLTAANFALRRYRPGLALSRVELITIYAMLSITSGVCSHLMLMPLVSAMGYAYFFQTPENGWDKLFIERLPHWLLVRDPESLKNFYYGNSTLYDPANFMPWIGPVILWSAFTAVLLFTMLCINSILRKQWVESERLTYPIIMLPLEMTEESGSLFRNRLFWLGFGIAGTLTMAAALNYLYPSIPAIRIIRRNVGQYIVTPPWNAMGSIIVGFYFWAIGIAFLMPLELSFSCWFFYWIAKFQLVASNAMGLHELQVVGGGFDKAYPFLYSQAYGAYAGFFVMSMWAGRHYLKRVFRTAFLGTKEEDESREAIGYRTAIIGAVGGMLFLCAFALRMGMSGWVVALFFMLYFILAIVVSRIRAELGFPMADMYPMGPQYLMTTAPGSQNLEAQDLVGFAMFTWFNKSYGSHLAPHQAEALKLSERTGMGARRMFVALMIAGVLAMPLGFWQLLQMYYHNGAATANVELYGLLHGNQTWNQLAGWLKQPQPANLLGVAFVGVGFAVSMALGWMRLRFIAFPFHPLAYALAPCWGIAQIWLPIFIGSTAKFLVLRFGGLRSYRQALPFVFGLILGEIAIGSLWTIVGVVFNFPTYDFWPGKVG